MGPVSRENVGREFDGPITGILAGHDFLADRTHDGRPFRILNILDEYTRECLVAVLARRIRSRDVLSILAELFLSRGIPTHIRPVHGPEFIARQLRRWLKTLQVEPPIHRAGLSIRERLIE
jgi:putative transposase